ncbi:MAG: hypothetical protein QM757_09350 [Paludibaculum sp.]
MLVARAEHDKIRTQLLDQAQVLLIGRDLPAALLDRNEAAVRDELLQQRRRIGHGSRTNRGGVEHQGAVVASLMRR